ncbi:uncharacterized protein BXZ73DRAFT_85547 [Epithele typhae]|uniref:uncharacterized protein n=1 Tax=Epithele typhae TaxID=378194 RepID=UPI0020077B01|nr:uncharacterized protein BXZ73DRAFT_85547 [Epithele typhae]KAH9903514.1 hypothetical protein BXZ73DRAFT_85547 [Epithele typhae]
MAPRPSGRRPNVHWRYWSRAIPAAAAASASAAAHSKGSRETMPSVPRTRMRVVAILSAVHSPSTAAVATNDSGRTTREFMAFCHVVMDGALAGHPVGYREILTTGAASFECSRVLVPVVPGHLAQTTSNYSCTGELSPLMQRRPRVPDAGTTPAGPRSPQTNGAARVQGRAVRVLATGSAAAASQRGTATQ